MSPNSIYRQFELPVVGYNQNVTGVDELFLLPRLVIDAEGRLFIAPQASR